MSLSSSYSLVYWFCLIFTKTHFNVRFRGRTKVFICPWRKDSPFKRTRLCFKLFHLICITPDEPLVKKTNGCESHVTQKCIFLLGCLILRPTCCASGFYLHCIKISIFDLLWFWFSLEHLCFFLLPKGFKTWLNNSFKPNISNWLTD